MKLLLPAAVAIALLPAGAGAAPHGGALRVFVTVDRGLAIVDADARRVVARAPVPRGSTEIAATADGHRVLVVTPSRGVVTQLDGVAGTWTRTFGGFGRPVDVVFAPRSTSGLVGARYAYVADEERALVDVLDLALGRVAFRLPTPPRPSRLALSNGELWIAHRVGSRLTVVDVSRPALPRREAEVDAGGTVVDLAAAPDDLALFVAYRGAIGKVQTLTFARRLVVRRPLGGGVSRLALDFRGNVWALAGEGAIVVDGSRGSIVRRIAIRARTIETMGGWEGFAGGDALTLVSGTTRVRIPVGRGAAGLAYAVLPS